MAKLIVILCLGTVITLATGEVCARTWTSVRGTKLDADLVEIKPEHVVLKDAQGKLREVRITALSEDDQRYIKSLNGRPPSPGDSPTPSPNGNAKPKRPVVWTMDPAELIPPDSPVAGVVRNQPFQAVDSELRQGTLVIRGGASSLGHSVSIRLFAKPGEEFAGRTFQMPAGNGLRDPVVIVGWMGEIGVKTETYLGDYALRLEFGVAEGDRIPGKLYLALPDESKSFLAGTFSAKIVP